MQKIEILDPSTIDKIAAGEVIERPASVVKELLENAIDAGATAITVEIKEGGKSFIRITDNGHGIPADQVPNAFLRHATSKIRKVEDLLHVSSLGFRGEALSSIAAIAQTELITKTQEALTGLRYVIEGGVEKAKEEIGAPSGTTFLIRNLFYNTPVRLKFLKSPQTEAGYISDIMERIALSHPGISFKFLNQNQVKMHSSGNNNLVDIIYGVYGREIAGQLIKVEEEKDGIKLLGYIGKPVVSRGNRNYENYYVNGRYVKSNIIAKAIEDGYKTFMMQHKYPFTALHMQIPGELLDVNVHPTKMELRFSDQELVYTLIYESIQNALSHKELIPRVSIQKKSEEKKELKTEAEKEIKVSIPEPFEYNRRKSMGYIMPKETTQIKEEKVGYNVRNVTKGTVDNAEEKVIITQQPLTENTQQVYRDKAAAVAAREIQSGQESTVQESTVQESTVQESTVQESIVQAMEQNSIPTNKSRAEQLQLFDDKLLSAAAKDKHKIIGQLFETYWMVEYQDKLFIIDQHAAHEKVLFERMLKNMKTREYTSQQISPPIILSLSMQEEETLKNNLDMFEKIGFVIEHFGGKEYSISAVPSNLFGIAERELLIEMLDGLDGVISKREPDIILNRIATASCKAAVKGNQRLSFSEMDALIDELLTLDNPYNCPHGRPTIISMSKYELEKKFKRIV